MKKFFLFSALVFFFIFFGSTYAFAQTEYKLNSKSDLTYKDIDSLIKSDNMLAAIEFLNHAIVYNKEKNNQENLANKYNALGIVFSQMSNYKNAEIYFLKAYSIYDSLQRNKKTTYVLSNLTKIYILDKNYTKFDSIYPIVNNISKKNSCETQLINLECLLTKNYYLFQNKELKSNTEKAFSLLDISYANTLEDARGYIIPNNRIRLTYLYKFYDALALIKLGFTEEGHKYLFAIKEDSFKQAIALDNAYNNKLATYNFYKYLYYFEAEKQLDSACKYLLKSDTYKYDALMKSQKEASINGDLIQKVINNEESLKRINEVSKRDKLVSEILTLSTIAFGVLVIILGIFSVVIYRNRKKIKKFNNELQKKNKELLKVDKERLELFSIISHELRTPIYGIKGLIDLIQKEPEKNKQAEYLSALRTSSSYISMLIDNMLQLTKLKFETKKLFFEPVNITQLAEEVYNTVKVLAMEKGLMLKLKNTLQDKSLYVLADRVVLVQVLINLMYNAIKYTSEGYVELAIKQIEEQENNIDICFEIKDTGIGIKKEHQKIIFNAFKNKSFLNENSNGSGLGLYIVKTLLGSHGAEIKFTSEVNKGSVFFFTLQLKKCVFNHQTYDDGGMINKEKKHKILIVDDNKINLMITQKSIEKIKGYKCQTVSNGFDAISILQEENFDLVLMDINMPQMNGYQTTTHIRKFNKELPIIALTALGSGETITRALESGMNTVITKPYQFDMLKNTILKFTKNKMA